MLPYSSSGSLLYGNPTPPAWTLMITIIVTIGDATAMEV